MEATAHTLNFPEMRLRPGTLDGYVVKEQPVYGRLAPFRDALVLDIGANIGAFARFALQRGARHVLCYEPEPDNFALLRHNTAGLPVTLKRKAVTGAPDSNVHLFVNGGKNKGAHSMYVSRGRTGIVVPAVQWNPTLLVNIELMKVDIEGGEYDFDLRLLPRTLRRIAVELHLNRKEWRGEKAPRFVAQMDELGWRQLREPKIGPKNWTTVGVWGR